MSLCNKTSLFSVTRELLIQGEREPADERTLYDVESAYSASRSSAGTAIKVPNGRCAFTINREAAAAAHSISQ